MLFESPLLTGQFTPSLHKSASVIGTGKLRKNFLALILIERSFVSTNEVKFRWSVAFCPLKNEQGVSLQFSTSRLMILPRSEPQFLKFFISPA